MLNLLKRRNLLTSTLYNLIQSKLKNIEKEHVYLVPNPVLGSCYDRHDIKVKTVISSEGTSLN